MHFLTPAEPNWLLSLQFDPELEVDSLVLGRTLENSDPKHVDLTPYMGLQYGISRRHIRLDRVREGLHITDLRSINGTWLNGERLNPGAPYVLRNKGILQLAKMILRVEFA